MADQFKFNPSKHAGTIFDPIKGRRVAVTDANMLPKINSGAQTALLGLGPLGHQHNPSQLHQQYQRLMMLPP